MAKKPAEQPDAEGGKSKKMLIIIIVAVLVLVGGGAAAYFLLFKADPEAEAAEAQKAEKLTEGQIGPLVNVESFIVNILDEEGARYLKAALTLEVDDPKTVEEINQRMPQVKDAVLLLVGNKTFAELQDLQGKLQLRAEISQRLNELLKVGQIRQIYFTDFVVQ